MKINQNTLILTMVAAFAAASCARNEPPVVAEQQPAAAPVAPPAAPEPVRESAWKPAPARTTTPKAKQLPASAPESAYKPAPAATPVPAPQAVAESAPAPAPAPVRTAPPPPPQPMKVTVEQGSVLAVRVGETLTSEKNETGDTWSGTLSEPLVVDGLVIAERGSRVNGRIVEAKRAGRTKGVAGLTVALNTFQTADGQRIEVNTSTFRAAGKDETKKDVGKVAIASGIGAAIGAIAGGGKGAAIGAGAGGAAGTGMVMATRGGPAVIPTETLIRFRVADPVTITERLK